MSGVHNIGHILGRRIRAYRLAQGLTLRQLAEISGIGHSRLQQLEAAHAPNPTLSVLLALQNAFGLASVEALLGDLPSQGAHASYVRASDDVGRAPEAERPD